MSLASGIFEIVRLHTFVLAINIFCICLPGDSAKMRAENGSEPGMPGLAPEVTLAGRWLHTGRLHGHGAAVAVEYKCSGGGRPCRSVTTERGAVGAPAEHVWQ